MKKVFLIATVCFSLTGFAQQLFDETALIENLKFLASDSLEGRRTGTPGNSKARKYIKEQFKKLKLESLGHSNYEMPFQFSVRGEERNGVNLIGVLKGKAESQKVLVISAHYDHVGIRDGKIYNGADDNASGVSALFALAEYFQKNRPVHTLIFVAFDAEEMGLQGAKALVETTKPVDQILANINMDMVSRADSNQLVACGTFYYPQLKPFLEKVKEQDNIKMIFGHDDPSRFKGKENWTFSSDHGPFHSASIPFIYFGVSDHADYHQPTDDFEKVNPTTYISCVKLILRAVVEIDKGLPENNGGG